MNTQIQHDLLQHPILAAVISAIIIAALGLIWRLWLYPLPGKMRQSLSTTIREATEETYQRLRHDVDLIKKEVMPNRGGSLRDAVERISVSIRHIELVRRVLTNVVADEHTAIWQTDENGQLSYIGIQVLRWTGWTWDDIKGDRWPTLIDPLMRQDARNWWHEISTNGYTGSMRQRFITTEKQTFWVVVHAYPVFDGDRTIGYVGRIERENEGA